MNRSMTIASADGTQLGVEVVGAGPPLLAVHGSTADRSRWAPVRDRLAEHYTLYLPDRRGRGASTGEAPGTYAVAREAEDIIAVLDEIGSDEVYYVGHSYGALIGLELLTQHPPIARALLYEPPFDTPGHSVIPGAFWDAFSRHLDAGNRQAALEMFYREVIGVDPVPLRDLPIWQVRLAAVHTLEREGRIGLAFDINPARFAGVQIPVRILQGGESPSALVRAAETAAAMVPGADLVVAPGQGHLMIDADPDGFVAQVLTFDQTTGN